MKEMHFSVEITASKEKIWETLWAEQTLRQWAGIIDPGTHLVGDLKKGNEVQFISENGYGVTSLVEDIRTHEFLLLRHKADTLDYGTHARKDEWTGGAETYELAEDGRNTILKVTFDVPAKMEKYFREAYPKALKVIKDLAEQN